MAICLFADQSHRYDAAWPMTYTGGPWKGLLHTTEGLTLPSYRNDQGRAGAKAPHFTLVPLIAAKDTRYHQHFDTARPSRALRNEAGGVQTNTDQVIQIELVGTCDPSKRSTWTLGTRTYRAGVDYIYWADAPRWALDGLARLMRWIEAAHGIPRVSTPRPWLPYPSSYGATAARMTGSEWDSFSGWCGHQNAPENLHGDPGDIDINYLLSEEDDMPTPQEIAQAVWGHQFSRSGTGPAQASDWLADTRLIVGGIDSIVKGLPDATAKAVASLGVQADPKALAAAIAAALIEGQDARVTAASPA